MEKEPCLPISSCRRHGRQGIGVLITIIKVRACPVLTGFYFSSSINRTVRCSPLVCESLTYYFACKCGCYKIYQNITTKLGIDKANVIANLKYYFEFKKSVMVIFSPLGA
jgi:hypothetical protein